MPTLNVISMNLMTKSNNTSLLKIMLIYEDALTDRFLQRKIIKEFTSVYFELDEDIKFLKKKAM